MIGLAAGAARPTRRGAAEGTEHGRKRQSGPSLGKHPVMAWFTVLGREACRWAGLGLDLLCPPRCAFCGSESVDQHAGDGAVAGPAAPVVCGACAAVLSRDVSRCRICGTANAGGSCRHCPGGARDWDGLVVLASYADEVRDAVILAKRPGGEARAAGLAALLVRKHAAMLAGWAIDVVVPVPMHWMRRAARGMSAADELARGVAAGLGLPYRRLLRRCRATPMQNELPFAARRGNVRDAFRAAGGVGGRRVLIVDDVTTTGATLAECRRALIAAGAAAVFAAAVARADRGGSPS